MRVKMRVKMRVSFLSLLMIVFSTQALSTEKILILGDSLAEGYGVDEEFAYPSVLQQYLTKNKIDYQIINGGVSGATTASGMNKLKWFFKAKPKILIVALGANDGLRGIKLSQTKKNLEEIIISAKKKGIKIIIAGMQIPPNYGPEYTKEFKLMFPALVKKHKLTAIPFLLEGVAGKRELNIEDGIHPNREGHKIISATVYKYLKDLL